MGYWKTPEEMGLSEDQITEKLEELWEDAKSTAEKHCHDCNAAPGEEHMHGCDVARCASCKGQAISCGCKEEDLGEDVWDGLWPGTRECYENRLITYSSPTQMGGTGWTFDYNAQAMMLRNLK